ncbi:MAG: hypothetical protein U0412_05905 [Nitrospira sp.]
MACCDSTDAQGAEAQARRGAVDRLRGTKMTVKVPGAQVGNPTAH